jgi:hypothetical protein
MADFINLDDLYAPHIHRDQTKYKFYNEVLQRCLKKIKKTNDDLKELECYYSIPKFIIGGPLYDFNDIKAYIMYKLDNNGLKVTDVSPDRIHISWKPQDINRYKYEKNMKKKMKAIEEKYNVAESKTVTKTIKNKKNANDNAMSNETEVGVMQYNSLYNDMVPVNPKKMNKFVNNPNFPVVKRNNTMNSMLLTQNQNKNLKPGSHLYPAVKSIVNDVNKRR